MNRYAPAVAFAATIASFLVAAFLASSAIAQPPKPPFIDPVEIHRFFRKDLQTQGGLDRFRTALEHDHTAGRLGSNTLENDQEYRWRVDLIEKLGREIRTRALDEAVTKAEQLAENGNPADREAIFKAVTDALGREGECQKMGVDCSFEKPPARVLLKYRDSILKKCDTKSARLTRAFVLGLERLFATAGEQEASAGDWAKCYAFIAKSAAGSGADFSGTVLHIRKSFTLNAKIPGGAGSFTFQPSSSDAGTVKYKMQGSGATDSGSGTYKLSPVPADKKGTMKLQPATHGCVEMPGFRNCADRSATILLTPK